MKQHLMWTTVKTPNSRVGHLLVVVGAVVREAAKAPPQVVAGLFV